MQLKHSFPITPGLNGFRLWQFIFDTPQGEKRVTRRIPFDSNEGKQAEHARAALASIRADE